MTHISRQMLVKAAAAFAALALALTMLAGCAAAGSSTTEQSGNRQYMSQVNQVMDDLQTQLASFTDAVSRDDVVGMQTQADNALATLDDLESIEAPDDLSDVHQSYLDGASSLRDALTSYVALYTEISSATDAAPFDWTTYEGRLADIQQSYDDGIEKMQEGDELAANKENGTDAGNSSGGQDGQDSQDGQDGQSAGN